MSVEELEALGYGGSKARGVLNCLTRLKRAALQRGAAAGTGGAKYVLLPAGGA